MKSLALRELDRAAEAAVELAAANEHAKVAWPPPSPGELPTYGDLNIYVEAYLLLNEARAAQRHGDSR